MNKRVLATLEYNKILNHIKTYCFSEMGRAEIEKIEPWSDPATIENKQKETSEAFSMIIRRGRVPFGAFYNVEKHMQTAKIGSYLVPKQLLEVADSLRTSRRVKKYIQEDEFEGVHEILDGIALGIVASRQIEDEIDRCIEGEDEISDHASPKLANIRRGIEAKNASIRSKLQGIISSPGIQKYLQDALITIRGDRFCIPVKQEYRNQVKGMIHDRSSSGSTLFIEPMAVVNINNELKELKLKEHAEIERILYELTGFIGEFADSIINNQSLMTEVDVIFAKARHASEIDGVEPIISNEGFTHIKKGRHPLIPRNEVVPTDVWIGKEFRTLLITGPNTGGKTVTLKTVGLLTLMAQAGFHIPASHGTKINAYREIYADIGDEQSIEQSLSTFSSHMKNLIGIIASAGEGDLVLLDELGAGTDPTEGAALAVSIIEHLYARTVTTMATTHYSELKHYALTKEGVQNASVEFDVKTLSPTYRLLIGIPGKSNAFDISSKLGLSNDIIEKAKKYLKRENIEFEEILTKIQLDRQAAEEERDEALRLKLEAEKMKKNYNNKYGRLQEQREKELKKAKEEARKIIKEAKVSAESLIKELRKTGKEGGKEANRIIDGTRKTLKSKLEETYEGMDEPQLNTEIKPADIKVGMSVLILTLNQEGTVVTEPDRNGELTVQAGIMKINVNYKNLKLLRKTKNKMDSRIQNLSKAKSSSISPEIDIRGTNVEEAIYIVDKYLDDAALARLQNVRIIHGKGTGQLRKGLHVHFRKHPHVKSFKVGEFNEGGIGVTVVEIK